jgi:hypothetical protein
MYDYMILNKIYVYHINHFDVNPKEEVMRLVDSCTTNYVLRETKYFKLLLREQEIF